jgi:DNA-directed RNA polymerase subunit RPC12/RpoP
MAVVSGVVVAAYVCSQCDTEGADPEVSPGIVFCWNCAAEATVTARIAPATT